MLQVTCDGCVSYFMTRIIRCVCLRKPSGQRLREDALTDGCSPPSPLVCARACAPLFIPPFSGALVISPRLFISQPFISSLPPLGPPPRAGPLVGDKFGAAEGGGAGRGEDKQGLCVSAQWNKKHAGVAALKPGAHSVRWGE